MKNNVVLNAARAMLSIERVMLKNEVVDISCVDAANMGFYLPLNRLQLAKNGIEVVERGVDGIQIRKAA